MQHSQENGAPCTRACPCNVTAARLIFSFLLLLCSAWHKLNQHSACVAVASVLSCRCVSHLHAQPLQPSLPPLAAAAGRPAQIPCGRPAFAFLTCSCLCKDLPEDASLISFWSLQTINRLALLSHDRLRQIFKVSDHVFPDPAGSEVSLQLGRLSQCHFVLPFIRSEIMQPFHCLSNHGINSIIGCMRSLPPQPAFWQQSI